MTQIKLGDTLYSLEESVNDATLGDLYALKMQTKTADFTGVSLKTLSTMFARFGDLSSNPDFNTMDLLDDEDFLINMTGLIWLAKRKAGEPVTFAEAGQVSFTQVQFVDEADADEDASDVPLGEDGDDLKPST